MWVWVDEEVKTEDEEFYSDEEIDSLMDSDELSPAEAAFMHGWIGEQKLAE